jgi:hypothetical protein
MFTEMRQNNPLEWLLPLHGRGIRSYASSSTWLLVGPHKQWNQCFDCLLVLRVAFIADVRAARDTLNQTSALNATLGATGSWPARAQRLALADKAASGTRCQFARF